MTSHNNKLLNIFHLRFDSSDSGVVYRVTDEGDGEGGFRNPVEGPAMLLIGIFGILSNLLCLMVLRR